MRRAAQLMQGRTGRRLVLATAAVGALVVLVMIGTSWRDVRWGTVGTCDFVTYWSAAQVLHQGGNPYDPAALLTLQQSVGRPHDHANRFLNPPWTLTLLVPMAFLPFGPANALWLMLHSVATVSSGLLLWRYFAPDDGRLWIGLLLAAGYFPCFSAMNLGQISFLLLAAVVGFLWAERSRWDVAAGVALSLLMIKPHLTYLFWAAAMWWAWSRRRWGVLMGWIAGLVAGSGVVLLLAPTVFHDYAAVLGEMPPEWASPPSIGEWVAILFDVQQGWLHFVPSLLTGLGLLAWLWRRRGTWRWEVLTGPLLLASVVTAAYGWSHDQVVLLPVVVALVVGSWTKPPLQRVSSLLLLVGAQLGLAAMSHWGVPDAYAIWHAPVVAALYWYSAGRGTRARDSSVEALGFPPRSAPRPGRGAAPQDHAGIELSEAE